ncbi:MAG: glucosaminidase domain-containing protein [Candidatus Delongbacteria bacterium]|nr:glucosaminidase domain-containing protein [Candidatus Delongbacteria bacterium]
MQGYNIKIKITSTLIIFLLFNFSYGIINSIEKAVKTPDDILPINDSFVIPVVYTDTISLNNLPVAEKKKKFFEMMLPAILVSKAKLDETLDKVEIISKKNKLTLDEYIYLTKLQDKYKTKDTDILMKRLHTSPASIVLAQSAIESGWGTSRFFLQADNPFGIWSFDENEDRIVASETRGKKKIYLKKFKNLAESIDAYFMLIATGPYATFRAENLKNHDSLSLVKHLHRYSEKKEVYVRELEQIIESNDLRKFDTYRISPQYIQ